jgi:hypothetical protein
MIRKLRQDYFEQRTLRVGQLRLAWVCRQSGWLHNPTLPRVPVAIHLPHRISKEAIHIVSAFAGRQRIVLGRVKVNEKSNEIVAIPALLDMVSIEGAEVSIDAMGCQRDIAAKIIEKKVDYILALKGSQGTLREDVEVFVDE